MKIVVVEEEVMAKTPAVTTIEVHLLFIQLEMASCHARYVDLRDIITRSSEELVLNGGGSVKNGLK